MGQEIVKIIWLISFSISADAAEEERRRVSDLAKVAEPGLELAVLIVTRVFLDGVFFLMKNFELAMHSYRSDIKSIKRFAI